MKKILLALATASCASVFGQYGWNNVGAGTNFSVQSLAADETNHVLYVGGLFTLAGGNTAVNVAKWDGANYSPLSSGVVNGSGVNCLLVMPNGDLIAGGTFTDIGGVNTKNIARWTGSAWNPLDLGLDGSGAIVKCLALYNNELYAGGVFTSSGSNAISNIAKWDGMNWQPVGGGINGTVSALCVYNGELYAGGNFSNAGGTAVNNVAKWNGTAWSDVGGGCSYTGTISVSTFQVYLGQLYAGGTFTTAGSVAVRHMAKWDGISWSDVGGGASNYTGTISVSTLQVFHNDLIVGGTFDTLGTMRSTYIGKWNGTNWSPMGNGMNNSVFALAAMADTLYAGGWFTQAGTSFAPFIAQWQPDLMFTTSVSSLTGSRFKAVPNPASQQLFIHGSNMAEEFTAVMIDAMGRQVRKVLSINGSAEISRGELSSGIYFYRVSNSKGDLLQEGKIVFVD